MTGMTKPEENEPDDPTDFITRDELGEILDEKLSPLLEKLSGRRTTEEDPEEELDDEPVTRGDMEKFAEAAMAKAIAALEAKSHLKKPVKKLVAKPPVKKVEETPDVPGRKSLQERIWGTK